MKKRSIIPLFLSIIFAACNSKDLSRDEALKQIKQERNFPVVIDYDIYCGDPKYGKQALDAGLEAAGLVTVLKSRKLGDLQPFVAFTPKAQPFLLPTPEKDKSSHIQRVKLADEELIEVTNVRTNEAGNKAVVDYTTNFKNLTPFAALTTVDFKRTKTNKAYFGLGDDGWKLEKKPGLDFLELDK